MFVYIFVYLLECSLKYWNQDRRKAELRIKNVGTAVANWRFVPKNSDVQLSEPWIHLEPNLGMVAPGEVCGCAG